MNREGHILLRAIIEGNVVLKDAVAKGDCDTIAAEINGWMPPDMKITAADVHEALKGSEQYPTPKLNPEVLRKRIDEIPELFSARINCNLRGIAGQGAYQAIVNELNKSENPAEHASIEDVIAAMELAPVPQPKLIVAGEATLDGKGTYAGPEGEPEPAKK